ncbi:Urease operon accessory protein [Rhizobium sp. SG2393]|uniref:Urease operon accessory protein n=1 Tax=Rhizobium sp. SG2393 TaxID=3276279 RepID=UPI00366D9B4F
MAGRRFAIVGNGPVAADAEAAILSADCVIRFNDCRSAGALAHRTDIVAVCNTGRPGKAMTEEPAWRLNPAVMAAGEIWSIRDPRMFAAMRAPLSLTHPELDDFCDDYTDGFAAICAADGKRHVVLPAVTHKRLAQELSALDPAPFVVPSTGLIVIAEVLWNHAGAGDAILLSGFGHQGWEWHPWEAERLWVEAHVAAGRLSRLVAAPAELAG